MEKSADISQSSSTTKFRRKPFSKPYRPTVTSANSFFLMVLCLESSSCNLNPNTSVSQFPSSKPLLSKQDLYNKADALTLFNQPCFMLKKKPTSGKFYDAWSNFKAMIICSPPLVHVYRGSSYEAPIDFGSNAGSLNSCPTTAPMTNETSTSNPTKNARIMANDRFAIVQPFGMITALCLLKSCLEDEMKGYVGEMDRLGECDRSGQAKLTDPSLPRLNWNLVPSSMKSVEWLESEISRWVSTIENQDLKLQYLSLGSTSMKRRKVLDTENKTTTSISDDTNMALLEKGMRKNTAGRATSGDDSVNKDGDVMIIDEDVMDDMDGKAGDGGNKQGAYYHVIDEDGHGDDEQSDDENSEIGPGHKDVHRVVEVMDSEDDAVSLFDGSERRSIVSVRESSEPFPQPLKQATRPTPMISEPPRNSPSNRLDNVAPLCTTTRIFSPPSAPGIGDSKLRSCDLLSSTSTIKSVQWRLPSVSSTFRDGIESSASPYGGQESRHDACGSGSFKTGSHLDPPSILPESQIVDIRLPPLPPGRSFDDEYEIVLIIDRREQFSHSENLSHRGSASSSKTLKSSSASHRAILQEAHLEAVVASGQRVRFATLAAGDALWVAAPRLEAGQVEGFQNWLVLDFILERKSLADLWASLCDQRYSRQKWILKHGAALRCPMYLIEGGPHCLSAFEPTEQKSLMTAMQSSQLEGFLTLRSDNVKETIQTLLHLSQTIRELYSRRTTSASSSRASRDSSHSYSSDDQTVVQHAQLETFPSWNLRVQKLKRQRTIQEIWSLMLVGSVPGIGEATALAIARKFPTVISLFDAYQDELAVARTRNLDPSALGESFLTRVLGIKPSLSTAVFHALADDN
uniref:Crossover junction endonuclease MUS81 n=1 Tax=Polytomella parva TaxID=51329 RepID=A0A7S0YC23_9CHLO